MLEDHNGPDNERKILECAVGETVESVVVHGTQTRFMMKSGYVLLMDERNGGFEFGIRLTEDFKYETDDGTRVRQLLPPSQRP